MLDYCDLLAEKKTNPNEDIYIETIIYGIEGAKKTICQWNGYELEQVFGICEKNVRELFTEEQWKRVTTSVEKSKFWDDNWRYSDAIVEALGEEGLYLNNIYSRPHTNEVHQRSGKFAKTRLGYMLKRHAYKMMASRVIGERNLFIKSSEDDYTGHTLQFCYKNRGIEKIDKEIREAFVFSKINDEYNASMREKIENSKSIAIHVRRGDMLSANAHYYKYGYFKRAVKYIKKQIVDPCFFFFCDPDSSEWVKCNLPIFGIKQGLDKIEFVSGNSGKDSFRDMQLMAMCKHAVVTNSSFGFWGAYLNKNPNKITCSPDIRINTTHTF